MPGGRRQALQCVRYSALGSLYCDEGEEVAKRIRCLAFWALPLETAAGSNHGYSRGAFTQFLVNNLKEYLSEGTYCLASTRNGRTATLRA